MTPKRVNHYQLEAVFRSQLVLIFGRNKSIISRTIRVIAWSDWSHVGVIDPLTHEVIEAKGGKDGGVLRTSLEDFQKRYCNVQIKYHPGDINICNANIGRKFDLMAIWGHVVHMNLHSPALLFCTQAIGMASYVYDSDRAYKLNPEDFEMSSSFEPLMLINSDNEIYRGEKFTLNNEK